MVRELTVVPGEPGFQTGCVTLGKLINLLILKDSKLQRRSQLALLKRISFLGNSYTSAVTDPVPVLEKVIGRRQTLGPILLATLGLRVGREFGDGPNAVFVGQG